jgi:FKBP-type peptidyl-prolyl cis-trans isomerase
MNFNLIKTLFFVALFIGLASCEEPKVQKRVKPITKKTLIDNNRKTVRVESDQIDKYIIRRGWEMESTGSGLRYMIYENGQDDQPFPKEYDTAIVAYSVSLINGKEVYKSNGENPSSFVVGHDNVESGLQEAIRFMKPGDKAMLIIPSHLAHGYTGDFNKIPRSATVIFDIALLELK